VVSDLELEQLRAASPTGGALGQIGASPDTPGATRGLPPETIGASPDIPGATRGLPPEVSGINAEEENKRRMEMMEQLLRNQYGR
jgi:hypothetical protein